MAEKLNKSYQVLIAEVKINITSELTKDFESVGKTLSDAYELALRQTIPRKQLALKMDVIFSCTGYALMIEGNPDHKIQSKMKTFATVAFGSKIFSPAQTKETRRNFWQFTWAFSSLHTICGKQRDRQLSWRAINQ